MGKKIRPGSRVQLSQGWSLRNARILVRLGAQPIARLQGWKGCHLAVVQFDGIPGYWLASRYDLTEVH